MANFMYNHAKQQLMTGQLNLGTADIRGMLVMTNTTADTEDDVTSISGFSTLDEGNGSGYSRTALTGEGVSKDATNNRSEFDANDLTFSSVGAGSRNYQALVLYVHVTDDSDSYPLVYIDTSGFPLTGNGGDITVNFNLEGILQGS